MKKPNSPILSPLVLQRYDYGHYYIGPETQAAKKYRYNEKDPYDSGVHIKIPG